MTKRAPIKGARFFRLERARGRYIMAGKSLGEETPMRTAFLRSLIMALLCLTAPFGCLSP